MCASASVPLDAARASNPRDLRSVVRDTGKRNPSLPLQHLPLPLPPLLPPLDALQHEHLPLALGLDRLDGPAAHADRPDERRRVEEVGVAGAGDEPEVVEGGKEEGGVEREEGVEEWGGEVCASEARVSRGTKGAGQSQPQRSNEGFLDISTAEGYVQGRSSEKQPSKACQIAQSPKLG